MLPTAQPQTWRVGTPQTLREGAPKPAVLRPTSIQNALQKQTTQLHHNISRS